MAVRADDFAFRDLAEHGRPAVVPDAIGHVELLGQKVVELENDRVCFATVHTWVFTQIVAQEAHALISLTSGTAPRLCDVALAVFLVVLLLVRSATRSAIVVSLTLMNTPPCELVQRLLDSASAAFPSVHMRSV